MPLTISFVVAQVEEQADGLHVRLGRNGRDAIAIVVGPSAADLFVQDAVIGVSFSRWPLSVAA